VSVRRKTTIGIGACALLLALAGCMVFNTPPVAEFSFDPTVGWAPLEVHFDASASHDPDGQITRYDWEFGDGATDTGIQVSHTYHQAGTYTIRFHAIDNDGDFTTRERTLVVEEPPIDLVSVSPVYSPILAFVSITAKNLLSVPIAYGEIVIVFLDAFGQELEQVVTPLVGVPPFQQWTYTVFSSVPNPGDVHEIIVFIGRVEVP